MFKDYYEILEVPLCSDQDAIKNAYRKQALEWHPDKHPDEDVTTIMQDINEAYAILKDPIKRKRYDQEYANFKRTSSNFTQEQNNSSSQGNSTYQNHSEGTKSHKKYYYKYNVQDEVLKEEIKNAQEYARKLVDEFFSELKKKLKVSRRRSMGWCKRLCIWTHYSYFWGYINKSMCIMIKKLVFLLWHYVYSLVVQKLQKQWNT